MVVLRRIAVGRVNGLHAQKPSVNRLDGVRKQPQCVRQRVSALDSRSAGLLCPSLRVGAAPAA
jgi:hypothetical protein